MRGVLSRLPEIVIASIFWSIRRAAARFLGAGPQTSSQAPGVVTRLGVLSSVAALLFVAVWVGLLSGSLIPAAAALLALAVVILTLGFNQSRTVPQANLLSLIGHLGALLSFYYAYTRLVNVGYVTDSIAGTYLGIVKVLQLQNPYAFSIKTVLDQLSFPPSLYTPRVDGTFEFHLNYPAMNFLALIPAYLVGFHDIRDGVLLFHIASILTIFALVPARLKAISLSPFALVFPFVIGYSWTDSVWAFFILLTAAFWRRDKRLSMVAFGVAVATKQIALVASPFLVIRLWNESDDPRFRNFLKCAPLSCAGFLVPNIPFVLSSPTLWWDAIVAPYLPGRTSMVPGGIGLSEILPDAGVALSPTFFTVLTVLVSTICAGFFLLRYNKLNRFFWIFPMFILFFYFRSLPNYILFWSLPYLFEWFRYGNPSLDIFRTLSRPVAMKRSLQNPLGLLKRRVGPIALLVIVLSTVIVGTTGAYAVQMSKPGLDLRVLGVGDPDRLGVATKITVIASNFGSESVSPRFFVKWFFLWDVWSANSTSMLLPTSTVSYELTATDALAAVPHGSQFRVAVYDSLSGGFQGLSRSYVSQVGKPVIANPDFRWWTLDYGTGRTAPFAWRPSFVSVDRSEGGIEVLDTQTSSGVELVLNSSKGGSLREVSLLQQLYFNQTSLSSQVYSSPSADSSTSFVFGLEATDHIKFLYFVLSPTVLGRVALTSGSNTTIILPFSYSSWQSVSFDIQSSWLSQGWSPPAKLYVSFFLRSSQAGRVSVDIQNVTV